MSRDPETITERARQEIDDAKAGRRETISSISAAYYLGMHYSTLSKLRAQGLGPKGKQNNLAGGQNAKIVYTLAELDLWSADRTSAGYIEQRQKTELAKEKIKVAFNRVLLELHELKAENARLLKRVCEKGIAAFATLKDALEPHDWLTDDAGRVLGHILTVRDAVWDTAWENPLYASLADVLRLEWDDDAERAVFMNAYRLVLSREAQEVEQFHTSNVQRNELMRAVRLIRPNDEPLSE